MIITFYLLVARILLQVKLALAGHRASSNPGARLVWVSPLAALTKRG